MAFKTILFLCLLSVAFCTLSKSDKKRKSESVKVETGAIDRTVYERGLVSEKPKWKDIIDNHNSYNQQTSQRNVNQFTLAYVTPWNNHGYDIAKTLGGKFTHISPVWLQVKRQRGVGFTFHGEHDIDQGWLKDVRKSGRSASVKIVPRLLFDGWQPADYREVLQSGGERTQLAAEILNVIKKHGFDGVVIEVWSQVPTAALLQHTPVLIRDIAQVVRAQGLTFILVIPPPVYQRNTPGSFTQQHFEELVADVDAFSLMTYDFSSFQNPGPNSPIWWMRECVQRLAPSDSPDRAKILLGLNLYGLDHSVSSGSHVLGPQFVETLSTYKPRIIFDSTAEEHYIEYKTRNGRHVCYYPTLYSISQRIELANELGTGVSLWEVGQGLDYFYDLL